MAAKKLGRTEGTIKGWVSRAMKALQQYVNPQHALGVTKSPPHRRSELSEYIGEFHATKYRHIMELYCIQLDNVPTIAAKLGIPEKDVRSRINQAQKYLRTHYSSTRDTEELKSAV
jgi:DNA-directed RNA polymerase specialized sigma24 family protein